MRSRKYGIQPMPPSDRAIRTSGNLRKMGDQIRSVAAWTMLIGVRVMRQSIGASSEVITICEDEPMCMHADHALVAARLPERIPVVRVEARPAQLGGILGESHGVRALGCRPSHLGRQDLGIPDGRERQRDEPARLRATPLVDVPVVVRLDHGQSDVLVLGPGKQLPTELRKGRKAQRPRTPLASMSLIRSLVS